MPSTVQELLRQNGLNFKTIQVEDTPVIQKNTVKAEDNIKKFYDESYILLSGIKDLQIQTNRLRRRTIKDKEISYSDAANKLQFMKDNSISFLNFERYKEIQEKAVIDSNKEEFTSKTSSYIVSLAGITVSKMLTYKKIILDCQKSFQKLSDYKMYEDSSSNSIGMVVYIKDDTTDVQFVRTMLAIAGKNTDDIPRNTTFTQNTVRLWKKRMLCEQKVQKIIDLLNNITEYKQTSKNKSISEIIKEIKQINKTTDMPDKYKNYLSKFFEQVDKRIEDEEKDTGYSINTKDKIITKQIKSRYKEIETEYTELLKIINKFEGELYKELQFTKTNIPVKLRYQMILADIAGKVTVTPDSRLDTLKMMKYLTEECGHYKAVVIAFRQAVKSGEFEVANVRVKNFILNYPFRI